MSTCSRVYAAQPQHLDGVSIIVEVDISRGLHRFDIVGLAAKAVDEARSRVGSALKNSGYPSPKQANHKTIVSLAPASIKKDGGYFDLAIAVGYLLADGFLDDVVLDKKLFLGELLLNGELAPIRGALPLAHRALKEGFTELYIPHHNAGEAAYIDGLCVYPVRTLTEVIDQLLGKITLTPAQPEQSLASRKMLYPDLTDIRGQETAKRALLLAACGGHNIALYGPPGTGKTMLAQAAARLLPELSHNEALEVTSIHSIAGTLEGSFCTVPPFRSPHHTASYVSVIGGGSVPRPGEITLAHRGILFLDEFPEFDSKVLEALRQPLEDRVVHITRANGSAVFPANCILIAALNPCPCGYYGSSVKRCACTPFSIKRYYERLSGPIMERIDMWVPVEHIEYHKLGIRSETTTSTYSVLETIRSARIIQEKRFGKSGILNAHMSARSVQDIVMTDNVRAVLTSSAEALGLSPRSYYRTIKLAQTIADSEGSPTIEQAHILEALQYRPKKFLT